jgi:glycosyltransferase involved in cell wall biosynthesis
MNDNIPNISVIVPRPFFPDVLLKFHIIEKNLLFYKNALEVSQYYTKNTNIKLICPQYFTLPLEQLRKRGPYLLSFSIMNNLKKHNLNFELVHAHRLDFAFSAVKIKEKYNTPVIVTCHGSDVYDFPFKDNYRYSLAKYVIKNIDFGIAVCKSDAKILNYLGLSKNKIELIPNGFNEMLFKPLSKIACRKKLKLPLEKTILLSIGTLHEVKGHSYLIDALKTVSHIHKNVLLIIIGTGPLENQLKKQITALELNNVILIGWIPHNELIYWINSSDLFVLPSLNEGFPTVIPEAMACGKPVIGTQVGGIPDVISINTVGLLVNSKDPESLAQGILDALNRRWDPEIICSYAHRFSLKSIVKQICQVYDHISWP